MQKTSRKQITGSKKEPGLNLFLKRCPECHSKLENDLFSGFQYCTVCGYWTRKETARLEPLMILE
jgi:hypothetical protein